MPLRILLDVHISPSVADGLAAAGIDVATLARWQGGKLREASDEKVLEAAHRDGRVLATYDLATIPRMLRQFADSGTEHSGAIFFSAKSIPQADVGLQIRCLKELAGKLGPGDLRNRAVWAKRP